MKLKLPPFLAIRYAKAGDEIRQIECPGYQVEGAFAKWTGDVGSGLVFVPDNVSLPHVHLLAKKPKKDMGGMQTIVRPFVEIPTSDLDLDLAPV